MQLLGFKNVADGYSMFDDPIISSETVEARGVGIEEFTVVREETPRTWYLGLKTEEWIRFGGLNQDRHIPFVNSSEVYDERASLFETVPPTQQQYTLRVRETHSGVVYWLAWSLHRFAIARICRRSQLGCSASTLLILNVRSRWSYIMHKSIQLPPYSFKLTEDIDFQLHSKCNSTSSSWVPVSPAWQLPMALDERGIGWE